MRAQINSGKSDAQIKDYLVERYGYFVLYKPPFIGRTLLLWLAPLLILLGFGGWVLLQLMRKQNTSIDTDTDTEKDYQAQLALFAEVLALQRGSFEGKPDELLAQAKALDANNLDVMMLLGQSAIQQKRYEEALAVLLPLKRELDASGEETDWLQSQIESIEQQLN